MKNELFSLRNVGIVLALLAVATIMFYKYQSNKIANAPVNVVIANDDHTIGKDGAKVVVLEYADYQCPACAAFFPVVKKVASEYQDRVKFIYRYFPLVSIHKNAMLAAVSAEAAGVQGKFWEMSDKLYVNQKDWGESLDAKNKIDGYAKELGLDMLKFNADMNDPKLTDRVNRDMKEATSLQLGGTPSFIINGRKVDVSDIASEEKFKAILDAELAKVQ